MYEYKVTLDRVVDGDTIDVNVDLGFEIWVAKQRVRLYGLDTWESRTRNLEIKPANFRLKLSGHHKYYTVVFVSANPWLR